MTDTQCPVCGASMPGSAILCDACAVRTQTAADARPVPFVAECQKSREHYAIQVKAQAVYAAGGMTRAEMIAWAEAWMGRTK